MLSSNWRTQELTWEGEGKWRARAYKGRAERPWGPGAKPLVGIRGAKPHEATDIPPNEDILLQPKNILKRSINKLN
jgi:hypothetical protein